jgi:uncharacterized SAM-binding protein YcdF (DUF218 family)
MTDIPPTPRNRPRRWWPRSRRVRRTLIVVGALIFVFCALTARLFVFPATGMPAQVDAIVVPGGSGDRVDAGLALARENRARYLVFSQGGYVPTRLCGTHIGRVKVLCFMPTPDTTQGEAAATARLAKRYGWRSIVLVTSPDQLWRAELRFRRCYNGPVYGVTTPLPLSKWPYKIAYQWAATVKAELVDRGC